MEMSQFLLGKVLQNDPMETIRKISEAMCQFLLGKVLQERP